MGAAYCSLRTVRWQVCNQSIRQFQACILGAPGFVPASSAAYMAVPKLRQILGCRPAMRKHEGLKRVMAEAPDFALMLMQDLLK